MSSILFNWLWVSVLVFGRGVPTDKVHKAAHNKHPFFISVVEVNHNTKNRNLEVSCKMFTDDLEKALRMHYVSTIDLTNPADKLAMDKIVNDYIQQHVVITVEGKKVPVQFAGYEKEEDATWCYFQSPAVPAVKKITVYDDLLYEYKKEQTNLVNVIENGNRKSAKLNNPASLASFEF